MWHVIIEGRTGRRGGLERRVEEAFEGAAVSANIHSAESADDVRALVGAGRMAGATNFAAVGGDDTAHLVLNALLEDPWPHPPTLAILPAGTGSDFIRTFGLPDRLEDMVPHLGTADRYRCDIAVIEGTFGTRCFLNVADAGVVGASVKMSNRLHRRLGTPRFAAWFWLALARFPAAEIRLEAGGRTYEGPAFNVVMANGQYFGGGINIAPRATLIDGKFDLQVFVGPRRRAFSIMPKMARGLHLGLPGVRRFSAPDFLLECPSQWPIEADGEMIGSGPIQGRMLPGAIYFKI